MIATNISGTNEAVYNEKSGLLIEPENNIQLVDAVKRLFEDKELQKQAEKGIRKT